MLYLVGENIDKHRAYRLAKQDKLVPIMRGILVESTSNIDEVILKNSIRISNYLYPKAYLSGVSAETLSPTMDGRIFLSGKRNQKTRLRSLVIVQTQAPDKPELESVTLDDELGDLVVRRSTKLFRFLESFRVEVEVGGGFSDELKIKLAKQLENEFGGKDALKQRLWQIGHANNWEYSFELATRFLTLPTQKVVSIKNQFEIYWHEEQVGVLDFDGSGWNWNQNEEVKPNPIRAGIPGTLPPFIENILAEGWLKDKIRPKDEREFLSGSVRYLSNIKIKPHELSIEDKNLDDFLLGSLNDWSDNGRFTGIISELTFADEENFEQKVVELYEDQLIPRLSGYQMKVPMSLTNEGNLITATNRPFTHILKLNMSGEFRLLPKIEHECLLAAESCGFSVPAHAILNFPKYTLQGLLIERFDVRLNENDKRRMILEELNVLLGQRSEDKYSGSIEKAGKAIKAVSTSWEEDCTSLVQRFLFAWLVGDGDLHLKNLGVLCIAPPNAENFTSVRMSPLYDAVSTQFFPSLKHDNMALTTNGKKNKLQLKDYLEAGSILGLNKNKLHSKIDKLCLDLSNHISLIENADVELLPLYELWKRKLAEFLSKSDL